MTTSREVALVFMGVVFLLGGMAILAVAPRTGSLLLVVLATGALWQIGRIDARRFRIDPWWLLLLVGAGALWQAETVGLDAGLMQVLMGAGAGLLIGVVPLALAEALGRRWPFRPGDVLLFAALGCLLGPWGLLQALPAGAGLALLRHGWVQHRRGRSWRVGQVALGPGMTAAAGVLFAAAVLDHATHGIG